MRLLPVSLVLLAAAFFGCGKSSESTVETSTNGGSSGSGGSLSLGPFGGSTHSNEAGAGGGPKGWPRPVGRSDTAATFRDCPRGG